MSSSRAASKQYPRHAPGDRSPVDVVRSLWFKQGYVKAIQTGGKTTTIRAKCPNVGVGDLVKFQVGARPRFAVVRVLDIQQTEVSGLSKVVRR